MVNAMIPAVPGVYEIRNLISGRGYIGSSRNLRERQRQHSKELMTGRHHNPRLAAAYAKHGAEAFLFVVLERVADEVFLRAREQFWLWRKAPEYNQSMDAVAPLVSPEKEAELSATRSANGRRLWADPAYRAKAIAARRGQCSNKGYRCTPEQIENRRRAARLSWVARRPR